MRIYAEEQIASKISAYEQEDGEKLQELYAARGVVLRIAYLRQGGYGQAFQENPLINGLTHEALRRCIYVGPLGASAGISPSFIRQEDLRTCR